MWLPLGSYCTTDLIFNSFPQRCRNQCLICCCCCCSCLWLCYLFREIFRCPPPSMALSMSALGFLSVPKCTNFNDSRTLCSWWRKADLLLQYTRKYIVYTCLYYTFLRGPLHNFSRNRDGLQFRLINCGQRGGQVFNFVYLLFIMFLSLFSFHLSPFSGKSNLFHICFGSFVFFSFLSFYFIIYLYIAAIIKLIVILIVS